MRTTKITVALLLAFSVFALTAPAQGKMTYTLSMEDPSSHVFHLSFQWDKVEAPLVDFRMPNWMPGYYQLIPYSRMVRNFRVTDAAGKALSWEATTTSTWRVARGASSTIVLSYDIDVSKQLEGVPNVAQSWLDSSHAYIAPAGIFLYPEGEKQHAVSLKIAAFAGWSRVATGLDSVAGGKFVYTAPDFDILYDCPILAGNLEELPSFSVKGVPHYFIGYQMGEFDRAAFMDELKKVVEAGINVIGDIPYRHYTFLGIGSGRGGVEHLNSTTVPFEGSSLRTDAGRHRVLNFLAHEYFHLYNVKRIRPIALGPFDYGQENLTNMLWVSEGFTVYYEYLTVLRAGLMNGDELLKDLQSNIAAYENKPGHLLQSATRSSYETWLYGPLVKPEIADKMISYYDKGPVLGMLLDFAIRHQTSNQRSLDDVMRILYKEFYQEKKRGFTDSEFQQVCERVAGTSLAEIFEYASTVKDIDYVKYLAYAGLAIDQSPVELPGNKTGKSWKISRMPAPDALQLAIRKAWSGE